MFKKFFPLSLAAVFFFALFAGPVLAAGKVRFGTPVKAQPLVVVPMVAAQDRGFFKAEGLELEWVPFGTGIVMHRAMAAGDLDMGMAPAISVVPAVAVGVPEIIVADTKGRDDFNIVVGTKSPIKEPKELKGAKVGVTRFGTATHASGLVVAKALGMEKDIKFVAAGGQMEQIAGLKAGSLNAVVLTHITSVPLKEAGEVRELLTLNDYLPKDWMDYGLFARKELADKSPDLVKGTIRAMVKATSFVQENPEWARARMKETLGYTEEVARLVHAQLRYGKDVRINRKGLENVLKFLLDYGIIKPERRPSIDAIYTIRFTE